jgi:Flp pilus assembly pilin Flp
MWFLGHNARQGAGEPSPDGTRSTETRKRITVLDEIAFLSVTIVNWFKARSSDEGGASLVEYVLLLALIAVVAIAALVFLGNAAANTLNNVGNKIVNS